jgi:adenylate kinase
MSSPGTTMHVVVLLGAPGAGKGTQAPILAEWLGVPVLASGALLRAVAASGSPLGAEVDSYMRAGQLVPDATMAEIFLERLGEPDAAGGAILDGFPRTAAQALALDEALATHGGAVNLALYIDVPEDELVERFADRRICAAAGHVYNLRSKPPRRPGVCDIDGSPLTRRPDDEEATVRARMREQLQPLGEVAAYYRARGVLSAVDGTRPIEVVTESLLTALGPPSSRPAAS